MAGLKGIPAMNWELNYIIKKGVLKMIVTQEKDSFMCEKGWLRKDDRI